ncbi:unnamed protein product [Caenorhabditis nigoni]
MSTPTKRKSLDQTNNELPEKKQKEEPQNFETQVLNLLQNLPSSDSLLSALNQSTSVSVCPDVQNDPSNSGTSRSPRKQRNPKKIEKFEETEEAEKSEKSEKSERVKCLECDRELTNTISNLRNHIKTERHMGLKPFKCQECESGFANRKKLRTHYENLHRDIEIPNVEPLITAEDKKTFDIWAKKCFPGVENLSIPTTDSLVTKCALCPEIVRRNEYMYSDEHVLWHMDAKPFKCTECDYRSVRKDDVRNHMKLKTHNGNRIFDFSIQDKHRYDLIWKQCYPGNSLEPTVLETDNSDKSGYSSGD